MLRLFAVLFDVVQDLFQSFTFFVVGSALFV